MIFILLLIYMQYMVWNLVPRLILIWKKNVCFRQNYWMPYKADLWNPRMMWQKADYLSRWLKALFTGNLGFQVNCQDKSFRRDAYWFGESQSRVVVSVKKEKLNAFIKAMKGIPVEKLGEVTAHTLQIDGESWGQYQGMETCI